MRGVDTSLHAMQRYPTVEYLRDIDKSYINGPENYQKAVMCDRKYICIYLHTYIYYIYIYMYICIYAYIFTKKCQGKFYHLWNRDSQGTGNIFNTLCKFTTIDRCILWIDVLWISLRFPTLKYLGIVCIELSTPTSPILKNTTSLFFAKPAFKSANGWSPKPPFQAIPVVYCFLWPSHPLKIGIFN